ARVPRRAAPRGGPARDDRTLRGGVGALARIRDAPCPLAGLLAARGLRGPRLASRPRRDPLRLRPRRARRAPLRERAHRAGDGGRAPRALVRDRGASLGAPAEIEARRPRPTLSCPAWRARVRGRLAEPTRLSRHE